MRRQAQTPVGFTARAWGFVNTLVNVLLQGRPSYDDDDTAVESREKPGRATHRGTRGRGAAIVVDFETGWRATREIRLTSFHDDAPLAVCVGEQLRDDGRGRPLDGG